MRVASARNSEQACGNEGSCALHLTWPSLLQLCVSRCSSLQLVAWYCITLSNVESQCIAAHLICITHLHVDVLQKLPTIIVDFAIVKEVVWILQTSLAADCLDVLCFEI